MKTFEKFKTELNVLKKSVIDEIYFHVSNQPDQSLDICRSPRIATVVYNDQDSEYIDELKIVGNQFIAVARLYDNEVEYDIQGDFDISTLVEILRVVEIHLQKYY